MNKIFYLAFVASIMSAASVARAEILTIIIDPSSLSYDLSPRNYKNSPKNFENSPKNYDNSEQNYKNSPKNFENSPKNYDNRSGGNRNLVTQNGEVVGYYVRGEDGMINFFNYGSKRVAYLPSGGHTQSVFMKDDWCGTLGEVRGKLALGITSSCYFAFKGSD